MKSKLFKLLTPVLAVVLCFSMVTMETACTGADVQKAVSLIAAYLPAVIQLAQAGASIATAFAPQDAPQIQQTMATITNGSDQLQQLCQQYTANPNNTTWQSIVSTLDSVVTAGDQQLLDALKISNPNSRQQATVVLSALDAALHVLDAYASQALPAKQVQAKAMARKAKLQAVIQQWSPQDKQNFQAHIGMTPEQALALAVDHSVPLATRD